MCVHCLVYTWEVSLSGCSICKWKKTQGKHGETKQHEYCVTERGWNGSCLWQRSHFHSNEKEKTCHMRATVNFKSSVIWWRPKAECCSYSTITICFGSFHFQKLLHAAISLKPRRLHSAEPSSSRCCAHRLYINDVHGNLCRHQLVSKVPLWLSPLWCFETR